MNNYLKRYRVTITALSPIHVGSGQTIGKKEYLYLKNNNKVVILDGAKLYKDICDRNLEDKYINYLKDSEDKAPYLEDWLRKNNYRINDYKKWEKYELKVSENQKQGTLKEIHTFVKDAYGMPYVPGSSIKGMIRTALIAWELTRNPEMRKKLRQQINEALTKNEEKNFLEEETSQLEQEILYTLGRNEDKNNAVNDKLAGIRVSDSAPIAIQKLTLCQKIDTTLEGKDRKIPLMRECLPPKTEIIFDLTIDTTMKTYSMEDIIDAINKYQMICNKYFYREFMNVNPLQKNVVWLGGGCGFATKTILYALYQNKTKAVEAIDQIFKTTLGDDLYQQHKHDQDIEKQVAPHIRKRTSYARTKYDMGMAKLEYKEVE